MLKTLSRRALLASFAAGTIATAVSPVLAQAPGNRLRQPVYRVANKVDQAANRSAHPLDPALDMARQSLEKFSVVRDYTATLVKRERINGRLQDYEYMFAKIRNERKQGDAVVLPFSVYLYFLKPTAIKGREVVYVHGHNNGLMMAHEGGLQGKILPSVWIRPNGVIAMRGNLYPLTDVGIANMLRKLIERGTKEKQYPECEVTFHKNAKINGRTCTLLQVKHPVQRDHFDFHLAQIFIDDEYGFPIRYAAYDWPAKAGGRPEVIEEYTYLNMKLNVGLTDEDFEHTNPKYTFVKSRKK